MQLEDYLDFTDSNAIRIKGHRIGIEHVVDLYNTGFSAEQIADAFPGLSLEKIYATITYYLQHRAEIDSSIKQHNVLHEHEYRQSMKHPSPLVQRLRLEALRRERRLA
jgi:uncharacterized protein (DUF433 family)